MTPIDFTIIKTDRSTKARAAIINTPHGDIKTPAFVAVGTKAAVKALTPEQVKACGAQVVLANTYHLNLQPGAKMVAAAGGLHRFMNWPGPMITDSGGFQTFSLGAAYGGGGVSKVAGNDQLPARPTQSSKTLARIDDSGVTFRSHLDGRVHRLTPETSMMIQHQLAADIIMAFDECTSPLADYDYQKQAMERTHAWAKRCLDYHRGVGADRRQGLFGIVQGGRFRDLRVISAQFLSGLDLAGFGIGGSFNQADLAQAVGWVTDYLPIDKPRHLLGIGRPVDLWQGVAQGIDTFDCIIPTREARNGSLYTQAGRINITNHRYQTDQGPIDRICSCYTCQNFSRAYLAHLFRAGEILASTLATIHNLTFIIKLVDDIRQAILTDNFATAQAEFFGHFKV